MLRSLSLLLCGAALSAVTYVEKSGMVSIEAEDYTATNGFERVTGDQFSGGAAMRVRDDVAGGGGDLSYRFSVQTPGRWHIWIRTEAFDHMENGLKLELDGTSLRAPAGHPLAGTADIYLLKRSSPQWKPEWMIHGVGHQGPVTMDLPAAGSYTLSVVKRKGERPRIDKLVLTLDGTVPSDLGPAVTLADGGALAPVSGGEGAGDPVLAGDGPVDNGEAPDGTLVRDPAHPQFLMRKGGGHVFICGPGDPEGFLYRGSRNGDGTRNGDQMALIDKLIQHGGNSIYMQAVRSHGGDGGSSENPFSNPGDPGSGINGKILDQWETWFTRMDQNGILIYLFLYDDGARPFGTGDGVSSAEDQFIRTVVDRFEHHKNLIFLVGEEANEAYSGSRIRNIAARIAQYDDNGHLIGSHDHSRTDFPAWTASSALDHYSMQYNTSGAAEVHAGAKQAFDRAVAAGSQGNGYQVIYSENTSRRGNTTSDVRNFIWEVAMAGVQVMRLGMDIAGTPTEALRACRILSDFFEDTDFYTMRHNDGLATGGTTYVLADGRRSYIAYARSASGGLGIKGLESGSYDLLWVDAVDGDRATRSAVSASGDTVFPRPTGIGSQCAVWIRKTGGASSPGVVAFESATSAIDESGGSVRVRVARSGGSSGTASVGWTTATGSAGASDFTAASGTLSWNDGESGSKTITIAISDDGAVEGDETFSLRLASASGSGLGSPSSHTVTIRDDDAANQAPVAQDLAISTTEGTPVDFFLTSSDADGGPGPYSYTIVDGPDHGTLSGVNNDRRYTPDAGYTGSDSFTWRVDDGAAASNLATVSITVAAAGAAFQETGGLVVMEAEHYSALRSNGDTADWQVASASAGFAGSGYVETPDAGLPNADWAGGAELSYQVAIATTGSYRIWLRREQRGGATNSAWVGADGSQIGSEFDNGGGGGWQWVAHDSSVPLAAGIHRFELRRREDGYRVDRILLTTDSAFVPSGDGPAESPRGATPPSGDLITDVVAASGAPYAVASLETGSALYIDRAYAVTELPAQWIGAAQIRTANDDKHRSGAGFLQFRLTAAATLHVAFDTRASVLPTWLQGWTDTGQTIATEDVPFAVYARDFAAGAVDLGGNTDGGSSPGSMYWVFAVADGAAPPAGISLAINFQPASAPAVSGYLVDSGLAFGDRGDGLRYGWDQANNETRDRNVDPDQRLDTLNHLQKGADRSWEIALPDGVYAVTLVAGDPAHSDQVNDLVLEGIALYDPDGQDHFDRFEALVEVTDGRLTLRPASGAMNAKLCLIEITSAGVDN